MTSSNASLSIFWNWYVPILASALSVMGSNIGVAAPVHPGIFIAFGSHVFSSALRDDGRWDVCGGREWHVCGDQLGLNLLDAVDGLKRGAGDTRSIYLTPYKT